MNVKLQKAKEYLDSGASVKEAAFLVGYDDQFAFSRMFKKQFGVSPREVISKKDDS